MAKRKSVITERPDAETSASARRKRSGAQEALPGMSASEVPATKPTAHTVRAASRPTLEVSLRVAPTNGPRQPARARQEPASAPAPADTPTPAEPKRPRKSSSRRIVDLREALAEGWEIVQPIFARPLWSAADDSQTAYNFVLRRDQATRLLTIPDSRTVERFIATHNLQIDYRR